MKIKPKIFIGSSIEGLSVAYSIQQNLTHDAEVTVWDQGVFELSKTSIESLLEILRKSDFGIFVFSNDDVTRMRGKESCTVRDNVLFEFGLFVGALSRERVYFLVPANTELLLPTDLLGVTPGKYEADRSDGSMQAATGPFSNQVRTTIKKLGNLHTLEETAQSEESAKSTDNIHFEWITSFIDKKYQEAIEILSKLINEESDTDQKLEYEIWSANCSLRINETEGLEKFDKLIISNHDNIIVHKAIAERLLSEDYIDRAINIANNALELFNNDPSLINVLSDCYNESEGPSKAINYLKNNAPETNIEIGLKLVDTLMNEEKYDEARIYIHKLYQKFPNNESVKYKYARIALELNKNEIALFLLNSLASEHEDNSSYWGYLSNSALALNFYDLALTACKKAEKLSNSKEEWIISNIGNMLRNKGFYTEGIKYLERGLKIDNQSEYAHNRIASSIKSRDEEKNNIENSCKNGRQEIREFEPTPINTSA